MPDYLMPEPDAVKAYPWPSWSAFRAYWGEMVREQDQAPKPEDQSQ